MGDQLERDAWSSEARRGETLKLQPLMCFSCTADEGQTFDISVSQTLLCGMLNFYYIYYYNWSSLQTGKKETQYLVKSMWTPAYQASQSKTIGININNIILISGQRVTVGYWFDPELR